MLWVPEGMPGILKKQWRFPAVKNCPHFAKTWLLGDLSLGSSQPHVDNWSLVYTVSWERAPTSPSGMNCPGVIFSWPLGTARPVSALQLAGTPPQSVKSGESMWGEAAQTPGACGRTMVCNAVCTYVLCSPLTPQMVFWGDRMTRGAFCPS